jgi:hypothetical protein
MRRLEHRRDGPASLRWRCGVRASGRWRGFSFCDRARAANRLRLGPLLRRPPNGALWRSLPQTRKFGRQPPVVVNPLQPREFAGILFGVLLYFPACCSALRCIWAFAFSERRILASSCFRNPSTSSPNCLSNLEELLNSCEIRSSRAIADFSLYQSKTPERRDRSR